MVLFRSSTETGEIWFGCRFSQQKQLALLGSSLQRSNRSNGQVRNIRNFRIETKRSVETGLEEHLREAKLAEKRVGRSSN